MLTASVEPGGAPVVEARSGGRLRSANGAGSCSLFDGDAGSSLMLMPVAVLIVLLLGAIAVDLSVVRLAHRDLLDVAASAANDAATAGLDPADFRRTGTYQLDLDRAYDALDRTLAHRHLSHPVTRRSITVGPGPAELTVELEMRVPYLFARSIPGAAHESTVTAHASAQALQR